MPANAKVSCDVYALVLEIVSDCQALNTAGDGSWLANSTTDEIHASQVWSTSSAATNETRI